MNPRGARALAFVLGRLNVLAEIGRAPDCSWALLELVLDGGDGLLFTVLLLSRGALALNGHSLCLCNPRNV